MTITDHITATDKQPIRKLLEESEFFYPFEVDVVLDLMDETLVRGDRESGYFWLKLEEEGRLLGFANFGPNPCTVHSWDLYWLAVDSNEKNRGLGTLLLRETEQKVQAMGGKILWAETSGRPLYEPTVAFYHQKGYTLEATLPEYYGPGDPKLVFRKTLD
jgi:GNAT superfamily N-acetyltransferase